MLVLTGCIRKEAVNISRTSSPTPKTVPIDPSVTPLELAPISPVVPSERTPVVIPDATVPQTVVINLTAKRYDWVPSTVRVPFGTHVRLVIKSEDVAHGISIREFNVRQDIPAGETVNVEFDATQRGEFTIYCSVFCGAGHRDMRGKLVVE